MTGGAGFIGSHFIRQGLKNFPHISIVNYDLLTYAGNLENLSDLKNNPRYSFVKGDICSPRDVENALKDCEGIVHFAAESHVDRSILGPEAFVQTNILGTHRLLEAARKLKVRRYLQVSTDEVYGSLGANGRFTETTPLSPNSPYSASKAAADFLCRSYHHTYKMDILITRCSNNYGPYQFPEKLIPLMISNANQGKSLPVYGDGLHVRDWIHVLDHCDAVWTVFNEGQPGEVYNIGSDSEWENIKIVRQILKLLKKPESLIKFVTDRPGHDRRYAMDSSKIKKELGWKPKINFDQGLEETVQWYMENTEWLDSVKDGSYMKYYDTQYGQR